MAVFNAPSFVNVINIVIGRIKKRTLFTTFMYIFPLTGIIPSFDKILPIPKIPLSILAYLSINFSFLSSYRSNRLQSPINNNRSGKYSPSPFFLQYSRKRWALIEVCLDSRFLMWCDMHLWYYFQKQQYSTSTVIRGTKVRWRFLFSNSCRGCLNLGSPKTPRRVFVSWAWHRVMDAACEITLLLRIKQIVCISKT